MKDYKLLLVGLILLLLLIFIGVFTWLWQSNRKNIDPLPIMAKEGTSTQSSTSDPEEADKTNTTILYIQAEDSLQAPLDDVITKFESRYPHIQVLARYISPRLLLTLPDTPISDKESTDSIANIDLINTDLIIADDSLSKKRLASLQTQLNKAQEERNKSETKPNSINQSSNTTDAAGDITLDNQIVENAKDNTEARSLVSFSYAIKDKQVINGVILTDSPVAISFRNFLLSSSGQDTLERYGYDNIDGYKNSMDDLFNPSSPKKSAAGATSVEVADALSNGK